ncbi:MAG: class I adenylate-forming enzyme family protein [Rhizobiaceae bacterium]
MNDKRQNNLGYWCSKSVEDYPERTAIIDLCGEAPRHVTYQELDQRLNRFASMISDMGLKPGDRMAMAVGNRFEFVEVMFGAMRAGVVPVPLNTKLGADVLEFTIRDAECAAAIVEPACNSFIVGVVEKFGLEKRLAIGNQNIDWPDYETTLMAASNSFDPPEISDEHPSFQPYTSGSTGRPKGVVLTHAGQLWWIRAVQKYWAEKSNARALAAVPLYHKNAMAGAIKPMLQCGGSVVLLPNFEPKRFLSTLAEYKCTQAGAVPAVYTLLLQHRELIASLDLSSLEGLSVGSAPVQEELMVAMVEAFKVPVHESYGLTEGGPVMIGPPVDGRKVPFGSCGVIWPEGEVKLVDTDGNISQSLGELWVRNPGVTPGYYKLPEVNKAKLVDGWLATGDLFSLDAEGFYYFRGRTDDMFNSGGENIYPKEVENLLLSHPAVSDASVVPIVHTIKGHVPLAMVLADKNSDIKADELKQHCLANGPAYAHPRRILIVSEMPLNGAGKVDRLQVQQMLEDAFGKTLGNAGATA